MFCGGGVLLRCCCVVLDFSSSIKSTGVYYIGGELREGEGEGGEGKG